MTKRQWAWVLGGLILLGWWSQAIPLAQGKLKTTAQVQSNQFSTQALQQNLRRSEPTRQPTQTPTGTPLLMFRWTATPPGTRLPTIQRTGTPHTATPAPVLTQAVTRTVTVTRTPGLVITSAPPGKRQLSPTATTPTHPSRTALPTRLSEPMVTPTLTPTHKSTSPSAGTRGATVRGVSGTPDATQAIPGLEPARPPSVP